MQLDEYGTLVRDHIHKIFGKSPSSFESFNDSIHLCILFPTFKETMDILHEKCLTCKKSKSNVDIIIQGKRKQEFQHKNYSSTLKKFH